MRTGIVVQARNSSSRYPRETRICQKNPLLSVFEYFFGNLLVRCTNQKDRRLVLAIKNPLVPGNDDCLR